MRESGQPMRKVLARCWRRARWGETWLHPQRTHDDWAGADNQRDHRRLQGTRRESGHSAHAFSQDQHPTRTWTGSAGGRSLVSRLCPRIAPADVQSRSDASSGQAGRARSSPSGDADGGTGVSEAVLAIAPIVPALRRHHSSRQPVEEVLGIPTVLMGFASPDDHLHAPDEKFHLPTFFNGIATSIHFLMRLPGRTSRSSRGTNRRRSSGMSGRGNTTRCRDDHRLPLSCRKGRRADRAVGHSGAARAVHAASRASAGIDRTVIFAAFHSDYAIANREVARIVASRPEPFLWFGLRPCRHATADACGRWSGKRSTQYGFVGIKVHRYDARITREICDVARAFCATSSVRSDRRGLDRRAVGDRVSRTSRSSFRTSGELLRRLARAARSYRSPGASPEHLHRYIRVSAASSCWSRPYSGPARARFCSARTGRGCIPAWSWRRSVSSGYRRRMRHWCSAAIFCVLYLAAAFDRSCCRPHPRSLRRCKLNIGILGTLITLQHDHLHRAGGGRRGAFAARDRSLRACARPPAGCRFLRATRCGSRYRLRPD